MTQSGILDRLPEQKVIEQRLCQLAAERNVLRALLRLYERDGFRRELQRVQRNQRPQPAKGTFGIADY